MDLDILLPFEVYLHRSGVSRLVVESSEGLFGLLPHRLDCVMALVPGILVYETAADGEAFVAVDEGVLVKTGPRVRVSVRRAIAGLELEQLRAAVEREFMTLDALQRDVRQVTAKLEAGFLRRFSRLQQE